MKDEMSKVMAVFAISMALGGCVTLGSSTPEGYAGPTAILKDTVVTHSSQKADFFYVSYVDGRRINDSIMQTRRANDGRGFYMDPQLVTRAIATQLSTFTITGRTEYAAPILALTSDVYEVEGKIEFVPEANKTYIVRGELSESYSTVWVEEEPTHVIVGRKIEFNGSAKLGIFKK